MLASTFTRIVLVYVPLLLLGFAAGALRTLAQRPGLALRRRRMLQALWVLVLLAGVPLWLVFAAVLHVW